MTTPSPLSVGDFAGLSEPAKEVIRSISNAIGVLYEPKRIREKAKAEADAAIVLAKADAETEIIKWQTQDRINYLEKRRQENINKIVGSAIQQLPETIDNERPDDDWLVQFFNHSQDVKNEEMQNLWSKILSGEFTKPNTFSLRTLSIVKTLNQRDARLFSFFCNFIWSSKYVITDNSLYPIYESRGLRYIDFVHLETIGLINIKNLVFTVKPGETRTFRYFYNTIEFHNINDNDNRIKCYQLTAIGEELFLLCEPIEDLEYLEMVIYHYSTRKYLPFQVTRYP